MTTLALAQQALQKYFGFSDFRTGQKPVIESVLEGHDTIVVMPTGGGKSVCYQLPGLMREGATVIVSPLIALMKDQTDALQARNLPATFINSSIDFEEQKRRLNDIRSGAVKLIYVAPERFRSPAFTQALRSANVTLFAIDEAHCISSWGHDFRPDYLRLKAAIEELGRPQVLALTATATPYVRADIIEQLDLRAPNAFVSGFDRPNLSIEVVHTTKEAEKITLIKRLAANHKQGSGIIYTSTRKTVEAVAHKLHLAGIRAVAYHAGMTDTERERKQNEFMTGEAQIIVATNAFGMGIDKPDIRFVVHYQLPGSVEAYYQEIGRAGRDGLPSVCVLLFNYADKRTQDYFIEGSFPPPEIIRRVYETLTSINRHGEDLIRLTAKEIAARGALKNEMAVSSALITLEKAGHVERIADESRSRAIRLLDTRPLARLNINANDIARRAALEARKLREVINFCYTEDCFRAFLLNYFGDRDHAAHCGTCGNCLKQKRGQSALSADASSLTAQGFSAAQTSSSNRVSSTANIEQFIRNHAPFGDDLDAELTRAAQRTNARATAELRGANFVSQDDDEQLTLTTARDLTEEESLTARKILACVARMQGRFGKGLIIACLRGSRSQKITQSHLDQLSTYGILADLSNEQVGGLLDALITAGCLQVGGGTYPTISLTQLGNDVMRERAKVQLRLDNAIAASTNYATSTNYAASITRSVAHKKSSVGGSNSSTITSTTTTVDETYKLYEQDLTVEDIAAQRNLAVQTIEMHLAEAIREGRAVDVAKYVNAADYKLIAKAFAQHGGERLKPLRDALPAHVNYRMIRFVVADLERKKQSET